VFHRQINRENPLLIENPAGQVLCGVSNAGVLEFEEFLEVMMAAGKRRGVAYASRFISNRPMPVMTLILA